MTDLSRIFKALGDPTRLAIYELVREHGTRELSDEEAGNSVTKIAARFEVSLSTVSHHLKELRNAGLIRCEKRGQTVLCSPDPATLGEVQKFVSKSRG